MKIEVTCRHADFPEALRDYASAEVDALGELGLACTSAEIVLDQGADGLTCEILLHPRSGEPMIAKDSAHEARAAVDGAVAKLRAQVVKAKDRRDGRRRAAS